MLAEGYGRAGARIDSSGGVQWAAAIVDSRRDIEARVASVQNRVLREWALRLSRSRNCLHGTRPLEVEVNRERPALLDLRMRCSRSASPDARQARHFRRTVETRSP